MKPESILEQAATEMKGREELYDSPGGEKSMDATVSMFNAMEGQALTEEQGWKFMCCLKLVRSGKGEFQADDYIDLAAYGALAGEAAEKSRGGK